MYVPRPTQPSAPTPSRAKSAPNPARCAQHAQIRAPRSTARHQRVQSLFFLGRTAQVNLFGEQPVTKKSTLMLLGFQYDKFKMRSYNLCALSSKFKIWQTQFSHHGAGVVFTFPTQTTTDEKLPAAPIMTRYFVLFSVEETTWEKKRIWKTLATIKSIISMTAQNSQQSNEK